MAFYRNPLTEYEKMFKKIVTPIDAKFFSSLKKSEEIELNKPFNKDVMKKALTKLATPYEPEEVYIRKRRG